MSAAIHFVGFRGEEFWSAVQIWGLPDIYHRTWDERARAEIAEGDTVVFARWREPKPKSVPPFVGWSPDDRPEEQAFNDSAYDPLTTLPARKRCHNSP